MRYCVLKDGKICDDCGECNRCDLDPNKICDNCMKCIHTGADYNAIEVDEIIDDGTGYEALSKLRNAQEPFDYYNNAAEQADGE